ncbi:restriction endonuclease [Photobacterium sp. CCB-ST2H9]|uniref:restriction endonuclease n=1 Tax=Photobacterium sp. CCB-ST2H9 TaxID=2912855 RepID=UPI0020048827|nr:restriction endonuclease [Photobacterium sp. CCB-ST2H9]UTM56137.1 restriction endonuclease [Photobacterium sp. CCB-ST2H9]
MREFYEFEELVKDVFRHQGFKIDDENKMYQTDGGRTELDFSATIQNKRYVVEVKFYRQSSQNTSLLKKATNQLLRLMDLTNISNGILVISSYVRPEHIEELERLGIIVISRPDIFNMASGSIELSEKLSSLLEDDSEFSSKENKIQKIKSSKPTKRPKAEEFLDFISSTPCLCSELKSIHGGKKGWSDYEKKCTEILKYLFDLDLTGWQTQQRTDDGLNRFDLVTRIRTVSDFWMFICNELDSRYVVFEFKNYKLKINQGQVLTTEKYLHKRALRSVAFIISRKGISDNALKFSQGAMREHGKLIVNLTNEDLCNMLDMKEKGDDPNDYMFEKVDSFLMSLPR